MVQRMFFHAVAIAALGASMAQTSAGSGSSTGPGNSMGQEQHHELASAVTAV